VKFITCVLNSYFFFYYMKFVITPVMSTHFLERPGSLVAPQRGGRRKIRVSADILTGSGSGVDTTVDGDESSGESRLSDTDMMSPDDDPDLDALLSPDLDTPDEMEDSIMERKFSLGVMEE
jgi:hypothetical protein